MIDRIMEEKGGRINRKKISDEELLQEVKRNLDNLVSVIIYVRGGSMRPFLRNGDTVKLQPPSVRNLRIGKIVLAETSLGMMLHRIVRVRSGRVVLMGDANVYQMEQAKIESVWGVVAEAYRGDVRLELYAWWMPVVTYLWYKVRIVQQHIFIIKDQWIKKRNRK